MARIPTYEQRNAISGIQSTAQAQSAVRADNPVFSGMANVAGAAMGLAGTIAADEREKLENRSNLAAVTALSDGASYWQQNMDERQKAWKVGEPDMRQKFGEDYDKWQQENAAKLPTEASRDFFLKHTARDKAKYMQGLYSFQDKSETSKLDADMVVAQKKDEDMIFANPSYRPEALARWVSALEGRTDLSEADKIKAIAGLQQRFNLAAVRGEVEQDPQSIYKREFGGLPESVTGGKVPTTDGSLSGALWAAQINQESGGKQFGKDGKPLTSSAGAIGKAQVMPGTAPYAAKLAGLPWDERRYYEDAGYNEALGKAYMEKQLNTFGGDVKKALAAYNMGPGSAEKGNGVAGLVAKYGDDWLSHAPAETRDYVAKITKRAGAMTGMTERAPDVAGGEPVAAPTKSAAFASLPYDMQLQMKAQMEQKIQQNQNRMFANTSIDVANAAVQNQDIGVSGEVNVNMAASDAVDRAQRAIGRQLTSVETQQIESQVASAAGKRQASRKIEQDNTAASLFDVLDKNGGDYQKVMADNQAQLASLPRADQDRLQKYAGEVATGNTRPTDWIAYSQLIDNPQTLAKVNLGAIRDKFSRNEFQQLQKLQQAAINQMQNNEPQTIRSDMDVVKTLLEGAGITNKEKQAQFFAVLQGEMEAAMKDKGPTVKKLPQSEINELANRLLTKQVTSKGWLWDSKDFAYINTIPKAERDKLKSALQDAGIPVNEQNLQKWYQAKQAVQAQQPAPKPVASATVPAARGYGQDTGIQPIQR